MHPDVNPGRGQRVDVGFVSVAFGVDEPSGRRFFNLEGAHQERHHLSPRHGLIGALSQGACLASGRDLELGDTFGVG